MTHEREISSPQVEVWTLVSETLFADPPDEWLTLLSDAERKRHRTLHFKRHRDEYLTAHAMLRRVLSQYLPIAPERLSFEFNAWGKPFLADPEAGRAICFSLSHTEGCIACSVSRGCDLGIDVENVNRRTEIMDVARGSFSRGEYDCLLSAPESERPELFFRFWTLKEAYLKATGKGLSIPLNSFSFNLQGRRPVLSIQSEGGANVPLSQFYEYQLAPGYRCAIAVLRQAIVESEVRYMSAEPLMRL